jgi:RNA recognition motif-containing protein
MNLTSLVSDHHYNFPIFILDSEMPNDDQRHIIKLRGLPYNSSAADILDFLKDVEVMNGEKGVFLSISQRDGRPTGEAFLELVSAADVEAAFSFNKNLMGHRYIESEQILTNV